MNYYVCIMYATFLHTTPQVVSGQNIFWCDCGSWSFSKNDSQLLFISPSLSFIYLEFLLHVTLDDLPNHPQCTGHCLGHRFINNL